MQHIYTGGAGSTVNRFSGGDLVEIVSNREKNNAKYLLEIVYGVKFLGLIKDNCF